MSFILDALRKSEHERQRQTGPALAEVAVAQPKPRTNVWATAAIVLLLVNLVAVGVLLLNRSRQAALAPDPTGQPSLTAGTPPGVAARDADPPALPEPVVQREPPPMLQPAREPPPSVTGTRNPLEEEMSGGPPMFDPQLAAGAAAVPEVPPAVSVAAARGGSVIYQSLPDAATLGVPAERGAGAPVPTSLPTADEITASGAVPALNLQLHVYSTRPQERFVFINGRKYREGDTLQEGPLAEQITADGVVLEFRGSRFLLPRD